MNILGNILWFILGGLIFGISYIVAGLIYCITIIGIPIGYQLMKMGVFVMFPFGKEPEFKEAQMGLLNIILNIVWILLGGIELSIAHLVFGALCCLTIIGIPFGKQHFKMVKFALLPFGQFGV